MHSSNNVKHVLLDLLKSPQENFALRYFGLTLFYDLMM